MLTLYFVRHGETDLNSEMKLRSWIDEPLNRQGIKEAEDIAEAMEKLMIDKIYTSDLKRAVRTAQIIADDHRLTIIPLDAFRPLNYGTLSGKPIKEIQEDLERLTQTWKTDPDVKAPKGESFTEFQSRNLMGLAKIIDQTDLKIVVLIGHLRNSLLFHKYAQTGKPLQGDDVQVMDGKEWAQEPGSVARYTSENGQLKYAGMFHGNVSTKEKATVS